MYLLCVNECLIANNWHYGANPWKWLNLHFAYRLTSSLLWFIHLFPYWNKLEIPYHDSVFHSSPHPPPQPLLQQLAWLLIPCMPRVYQAYSYLRAFLYMFVNTSDSLSPPSLCWNAPFPDRPFLIWNSPSHPPNPPYPSSLHLIFSIPPN